MCCQLTRDLAEATRRLDREAEGAWHRRVTMSVMKKFGCRRGRLRSTHRNFHEHELLRLIA